MSNRRAIRAKQLLKVAPGWRHWRPRYPRHPRWTTTCRFCRQKNTDHAAKGKCLYEPTYFQSMSIDEYNALWADFDKEFWIG